MCSSSDCKGQKRWSMNARMGSEHYLSFDSSSSMRERLSPSPSDGVCKQTDAMLGDAGLMRRAKLSWCRGGAWRTARQTPVCMQTPMVTQRLVWIALLDDMLSYKPSYDKARDHGKNGSVSEGHLILYGTQLMKDENQVRGGMNTTAKSLTISVAGFSISPMLCAFVRGWG